MVRRVVCALAMILGIAVSPVNSQSLWHWQYPSPQGNDLYDVDVFASTSAVAVGNLGAVITSTNGGATWTVRPPIRDLPNLRGVSFVGSVTLVAVGDAGTIRRSSNLGATWVIVASGTTSDLLGVDFGSNLYGTAVGRDGTILRSDDHGHTWTPQSSGTSAALCGVCFVDPMTGTAVGTGGTILRTTDGGATWTPQTSGITTTLLSVDFLDANTGIAVGNGRTALFTTNGGVTWSPRPPPQPQTLFSVDMIDATHAVAACDLDVDLGGVVFTDDGGTSWSLSYGESQLYGVAMFDDFQGVAVGAAGIIRRTTNGGGSWTQVGGGFQRCTMEGVDFVDPQRGVAVARDHPDGNSRAYVTTNGGAAWTVVAPFYPVDLYDVAFADASTVYAIGDGLSWQDYGATIWRSEDGGVSWMDIMTILCWPGNPYCIRSLRGIDFADASTGVAVGTDGAIVEIHGGGPAQVTSPTTETLNAVSVPTPNTACAVGNNGTIIAGTPGGLWLTKYSGTSVTLNDVCFVDELNGTAVGDGGTILRTTDGGNFWSPQVSGTTANLTSVDFRNTNDGIIAAGTTMLKTRDGGMTWVPEDLPVNAIDLAYRDAINVTAVGGDECIVARWDGPVPVLFQNVTARANPGSVELSWVVEADEPVRGFQVYRAEGSEPEINLTPTLLGADEGLFVDNNVVPGASYRYTVVVVDGKGMLTRSQPAAVEVPRAALALHQNHPNPFNPSTTIGFALPERMHVTLAVYDPAGRRIATLVDDVHPAGEHEVTWEATGVPSGVYFCRIDAGGVAKTRKMVLLK